jgi:threonine dehydrogenase-like Zn-dependent dehydrogenase
MRAITVRPGQANSAQLEEIAEPLPSDGALLVRARALGVCGTDREIVPGEYGWAPAGEERLVLGHESLGTVEQAPNGCGFAVGDWVVGIVRRPDPVPCPACAMGEWDMCRNGRYTERGIKQRHGYGAERYRLEPDFAVKVDPALGPLGVLLEPASILAKAWDQTERIGHRTGTWRPRTVLVTGAGPIGLIAALFGLQRGLEVHVLDRVRDGPKPRLVRALGATYHTGELASLDGWAPDIIMECTGAPSLVSAVLGRSAPCGVVCLTGVSRTSQLIEFDTGGLNRTMVLHNDVVFGTVNANRAHYRAAAAALVEADRDWLAALISRRVPLDHWHEALVRRPDDIKVVIEFV